MATRAACEVDTAAAGPKGDQSRGWFSGIERRSFLSTDRLIAGSIILPITFRYLRPILTLRKETGGTQMLLSEKVLLMVGGPMATLMTLATSVLAIL